MRTAIRQFLGLLRWPIGLMALLGLPAALLTLVRTVQPLLHGKWLPFWVGLGVVFSLWALRWHRSRWARFITTIEHESLHALVGMLTLIPIRELKVREDGSGHVLFEPPGHWLLYLAPYFIPLLLLAEIGVVKLIGVEARLEMGLLGMLLGLECLGHVRQLHPRQTDFRMAGRAFTLAFLPTAFILAYTAAIAAMTQGGLSAILPVMVTWASSTWADIHTWGLWAAGLF